MIIEMMANPDSPAITEIKHLMIPGRGRDRTGHGLSKQTIARVVHAARVYRELDLWLNEGRIVCSGYKTPADQNGQPYRYRGEVFQGVPEALSSMALLWELGVDPGATRADPHSIDTATNFVFTEQGKLFGDGAPVGIVAQRSHLERMMEIVAPRTLRRPYIGIVAPETSEQEDHDSLSGRLVSRAVLLGVRPEQENSAKRVERRVKALWGAVTLAERLRPGDRPVYMTDS